mgnify:CR=1 FL=1
MSCTLLHHGHVRLLKKASKLGKVIVALTTDDQIVSNKGYAPELLFHQREEILLAIKYVSEVIPSNWLIDDEFILTWSNHFNGKQLLKNCAENIGFQILN